MTSADSDTPASTTDSAASAGSEALVVSGPAEHTAPSALVAPTAPAAFNAIPAWRSPAAWCVLFLVFIAAVSLDLWSKDWAFRTVAPQPVVLVYEQVSGNPGYSLPAC